MTTISHTGTSEPINFLWFIPTSGDGTYLGSSDLNRAPEIGYLTQIAQAVDRLGYSGVLLPTGVACEESFVTAAALAAKTEKLQFLVAIRPGTASPAYYARLATTLDRISNGRLLLNIVVGGSPAELAGDGIHLEHDERYAHAEEFFTVFEELLEKGTASFDGKYIKATNARLGFPSVQNPRPPLYFGGSSDAGIDFSVGRVDKYLTWGEPPAQVAEKITKVRKAAGERSREVSFGIRLHFIVRETDEEAWEAAERLIRHLDDDTIREAQERFVHESDLGRPEAHGRPSRRPARQARSLAEPLGRRWPGARRCGHGAGRLAEDGGRAPSRVSGDRHRYGDRLRLSASRRGLSRRRAAFPRTRHYPRAAAPGLQQRVRPQAGLRRRQSWRQSESRLRLLSSNRA